MAVRERRTHGKSRTSKSDLLDKPSNLVRISLREGITDLLSLLEDVESALDSEDLTELERRGFILTREYLKEATILELRGLPRASLIDKIREIASILEKIGDLREEGVQVISLNDLIVVGEVDGRPVYSIKREKGDSHDR